MSTGVLTRTSELENLELHDFEPRTYRDYESKIIPASSLDSDKFIEHQLKMPTWSMKVQTYITKYSKSHISLSGLLQQLIGLMDLQENVEGDLTEVPAISSIVKAKEFLAKLEQLAFLPSRVVASSGGGVGLVFLTANKQADIEIFNSGEVLAGIYPYDRDTEVWVVSLDDLEYTVERIRGFLFE